MNRTIIALVAAALILPMVAQADSTELVAATEDMARPGFGQLVVGFLDMPDIREGDFYLGEPVVSATPALGFITVRPLNLDVFEQKATLDANVRYVESDVSDHVLHYTPNDFYWSHASNWGVTKIGADVAWDTTLGSTSVKDGHIDSGLVATHEDLSGSRWLQGYDFYNGDSTPEDESGCNWHGSHTAGTVGATINNGKGFAGMAQITMLPVKIFGGALCWAGSTTDLANALRYVGDQGSQVSSNSWGGGSYSTAINDAITYSTNLGVIFVASSGNGGCNNCVGNPWVQQAANTIIVTATDSSDNGASFNSKGPQVDVSAPGVYIGSAGGPGSSYYIMDGTSMAAPHVAGLVGLVKSVNPSWTRQQVTDQITGTAVDLGASGHDDTFGWGRIDAAAAVGGGGPPADPACSDGIDNDGDGLTDYPADPGCTSASDDDEFNAPPSNDEVHTHDLDIWKQGKSRKFRVWAFDDGEAAESGVSVSIEVTHDDGDTATGTADTGSDGSVTFNWKHGNGSYTVCVTSMSKAGFTWNVGAGHASAGNCHTAST